jgi:hypothetical protein
MIVSLDDLERVFELMNRYTIDVVEVGDVKIRKTLFNAGPVPTDDAPQQDDNDGPDPYLFAHLSGDPD